MGFREKMYFVLHSTGVHKERQRSSSVHHVSTHSLSTAFSHSKFYEIKNKSGYFWDF